MNSTKRMLQYVRHYVIVAVYDILDQDGINYKKTDSSTIELSLCMMVLLLADVYLPD